MTKWQNLADLKPDDFGVAAGDTPKKKTRGAKKPLSSAEYRIEHGAKAWALERRQATGKASIGDASGW